MGGASSPGIPCDLCCRSFWARSRPLTLREGDGVVVWLLGPVAPGDHMGSVLRSV